MINKNSYSVLLIFSQIAFCVTIVTSVSPSCTSTDARSVSSSELSLAANIFATAVTADVISQEFKLPPPLSVYVSTE